MSHNLSVYLGPQAVRMEVSSVQIDMANFMHEMATILVRNQRISSATLTDGSPVRISFTDGLAEREFVGYIHHIQGSIDRQVDTTKVVCIGATYILKQSQQSVFRNLSATAVAAEVCERNRLSHYITPNSRMFDQLVQAGETDWKFLVYLANLIGYTVYPDGASVVFEPRLRSWTDSSNSTQRFLLTRQGDPRKGSMFEFSPTTGTTLPTPDGFTAVPVLSGVDPKATSHLTQSRTGKRTTLRTKPVEDRFTAYRTGTVINSLKEGMYEAEAFTERNAFPLKATAKFVGSASLTPNSPVFLKGVGSEYSGYWVIDAVTHVVENGQYFCHANILSDSFGRDTTGSLSPEQNVVDLRQVAATIPVVNTLLPGSNVSVLPSEQLYFDDLPKWAGAVSSLRRQQ